MVPPASLAQVFLYSVLSILLAQAPTQSTPPVSKAPRLHINQDQLCCSEVDFVEPIYPRAARLAHTEGVVKIVLIIAHDGSVADLQAVSGDPLLLDSTIKAVRQWRISINLVTRDPTEAEVPLSFTFSIEDAPKPAYLHLIDGKVIRADEVREFTDRIEYSVGHRTHHLSADSVTEISACARVTISSPQKEGDCIPSGGPSFLIRAIPLLPADKNSHSFH